jgi:hypothetical protein
MNESNKLAEAARTVGYWAGVLDGRFSDEDYDKEDLEFKLDCAEATLNAMLAEPLPAPAELEITSPAVEAANGISDRLALAFAYGAHELIETSERKLRERSAMVVDEAFLPPTDSVAESGAPGSAGLSDDENSV